MVRVFDSPLITNDQSIDRVLATGLPVLLLFLNNPALPEIEQTLNQLAKNYAGQILIAKVMVKDSPATARRYNVVKTPTLLTIRNGEQLTMAEAISSDDLKKHAAFLAGKGPKPGHQHPATSKTQNFSEAQGPRNTSDATFDQDVFHSSLPVLVDFWAPWCGPCRMIEPIMEKWAHEYAGRFNIYKMNVDQNPRTASRYGIQSIPTMFVVKNGQLVDRWVGALPESAIRNRLAGLLGI